MKQKACRLFLCLGLCFLSLFFSLPSCAETTEDTPVLTLTSDSDLYISNAVYHYVKLNSEVQNADQLMLRVLQPDGEPAAFKTRKRVNKKEGAVRATKFSVRGTTNGLNGTEILFPSKIDVGTWTIEVQALQKEKTVATATLTVEVWDMSQVQPADYEQARTLLQQDEDNKSVEQGKIRFVTQISEDHCFTRSFWKNTYYNLLDTARTKCTRAVFSMALSWLGIDCTPVAMSSLVRSQEIFHTYEAVVKALGNVTRTDGNLEELWENYTLRGASPVAIHFVYDGGGGMHALLLIGRDSICPDLYYAVNPSEGVDAREYGGKRHDHIIPVFIEEGKIGTLIQSPLVKRYNKSKIDVICQWSLTETTEETESLP